MENTFDSSLACRLFYGPAVLMPPECGGGPQEAGVKRTEGRCLLASKGFLFNTYILFRMYTDDSWVDKGAELRGDVFTSARCICLLHQRCSRGRISSRGAEMTRSK